MSKKDAYYFSHDANSQDDPKCMILIDELGMEGYGIFWALIEKLRSESEYKLPLAIVSSLAKRWSTSAQKVNTVIKKYGLFNIENDVFFSLRLIRSMELKSEKARISASYRWNSDANALRTHTDRNATGMRNDAIKVKERKVKERKVNNAIAFVKPTIEQLIDDFTKKTDAPSAEIQAPRFFNHYEANGWMVGKTKMKSWPHAVSNWISNSSKFSNATSTTTTGNRVNSGTGGLGILTGMLEDESSKFFGRGANGAGGEV